MSNKKSNDKLIYVEPNFENAYQEVDSHGISTTIPFAPDLTDFCISVDLEVEVRGREVVAQSNSDKKIITMSWNNSKSENSVSFMQGTTINFDRGDEKSGFVNSLTTSYTDIFYNDIKDDGTNEMFGISSIDIDYNNYFVPQITINFIDIRGVSLFAPEQLRHSDSRDGIGGFSNDDVAGSFFKCFFTFPYPKFRLRVKGFYGQPVSYELTCSDFRATFDSNTGNFGAKATFIGYSFSLLNDVTLNALSVAPLSDYLGKEYWESKLNTTFTVKDAYGNDSPMLTLSQLIRALKDAKKDLGRIGSSSPIHQEQTKLQKQLEALNAVSITYNDFITKTLEKLDKRKPDFANDGENSDIYTLFRQYNNKGFILLSKNSKDDIENYVDVDEFGHLSDTITMYNALSNNGLSNNKIQDLKGSFVQILKLNDNGKLDFYKDSSAKGRLDSIFQNDSSLKNNINNVILANNNKDVNKRVLNEYVYGYLYSDNGLVDKISELKTELQTAINNNQKDVTQFENESVAKSVGFIPNVYNVTKIIMAHLETLMYMIYTTAGNVGDRTASSMGIELESTDVNLKKNSIPPFPKLTIETKGESNQKRVDRWIGECNGNIPERDLVHGLLNGIQQLSSDSFDYANDLKNTDSDGMVYTTPVKIPLTPLDMLLTKNPFGNTINFKDISDFIGRVVYRMYSTLSLPNFDDDWLNQASILGKADAVNFATLFKIPSDDFIRRLNLPEFTADFMLDIAMNSNKGNIQNERIDNRWAWDGDSVNNYPLIIKTNGNPSLNLYKVSDGNNIVNYVMPLQASTFSEVIKDMNINDRLTGGMPKDLNNYFTTSDLMTDKKNITSNPNLFLIDENIEKYSILMQQIKMESDDMSKISSYFNCIYDSDKYDRYFKSTNTIGTTLTFSNEEIDFGCRDGNRLLSSNKRTQEEISEINIFSNKAKGLMYPDFEGIVDTDERERDFGFDKLFNDLNSIGNYTIPAFAGYTIGGVFVETLNVTTKSCLFGQYCYYLQNQASDSQLVKSLMFLDTLSGLDFDDFIDDLCDNKENATFIAPKIGALLCGAYLWRYEKMSTNGNNDVVIKNEYFSFDANSNERLNGDNINNKLFKLRNEIKQYLINYFIKWSETDFSVNIQTEFELRTDGGVVSAEFIKDLSYNMLNKWADGSKFKLDGYINLEDYLTKTFSDNFFRNYISISMTDTQGNKGYSVKLYNRELSNAVIYATNLYVTPCVILKGTKYIFNDQGSRLPILKNGVEKVYLTSFIKELKKQYESIKNSLSSLNVSAPIAKETNTDVHIKIALYKYCKLIYDRWVGGTKFDDWKLENFFEEHFHFIDAYYNKIGNDALVNLTDIVDRLISSNTQNEYSLLSFLSDVLAKSSFQLLCIQNFSDLSDKDKMSEMFKPISYNEMAEAKIHPDFVVMYSYEYSHNLDIENSEYTNDGLMIDSDNSTYWPDVIKNKDMNNGYTIPAFGVSYGGQYQSYFSDINVSMESPMVTEQSIKAQYLIAGEHNPSSDENGRDKVFLGQDLFTIYSNNSYTCTVTMMGCAWVQPLMYFCLLNVPLFKGAYLIQKVTHHMEPGNMTTTITGVRMCGTATPLVNRWYYEKLNNEAGGIETQEQKEETNRLASIDNDCEYKVFPTVYQSSNGPTLNIDDLKGYKELGWLDKFEFGAKNDYRNLYQAIMATVAAEVGGNNGEGKLGAQLVTVVMINRLMDKNNNWENVLVKGQMAVGVRAFSEIGDLNTDKPNGNYNELFEWVEEVLVNGPTVVVGEKTTVTTNVPKFNLGEPTGEYTESTEITLDDVQKIYMYCTTNGYGPREKNQPVERTVAYWRDSEYFLHHKGHVFTGHLAKKNEPIHWKAEPKKSNVDESSLSDLAQGVLEAMKKTAKISENINVDIIGKKGPNSNNEIILTCDKKDKMSSIFDIALNGYYDSFSKIYWVIENDNKMSLNDPISVVVEVKDTNTDNQPNRSVAVVRDGDYEVVKNYENLSPLFHRSLSKKYNPLTSQDVLNTFKVEAKNFITEKGGLVEGYNTFLTKNAPSPCPVGATEFNGELPEVDKNGLNLDLYKKCLAVEPINKILSRAAKANKINIVGVRSKLNSNGAVSSNKFIDVCVIVVDGTVKFLAPFTTVPGHKSLVEYKKYNEKGVSILKEGYYEAWLIGKHQNRYKALVQRNANVTTYRDNSGDVTFNYGTQDSGFFGINIHRSGEPESLNVNNWSAGCQVFKRIKDFNKFLEIVEKSGEKVFGYTLINEENIPDSFLK